MKVYHITRREWGEITEYCEYLNANNPDTTTIFVEFMNRGYSAEYPEILEVTKALITIPIDR